jgi:hypothetical protein
VHGDEGKAKTFITNGNLVFCQASAFILRGREPPGVGPDLVRIQS